LDDVSSKKGGLMKFTALFTGIMLMVASASIAGGLRTYQVTGPVIEIKGDVIVVQKGKEKWDIAKDKDTKITGDVKVGSKVKIMYTMKAVSIETSGEAKKKSNSPH
jgi:hypothetical protein